MAFVPDEAPTAAPTGRFVPDAPAPGEQDTSSLEAFRKSGMPSEKETGLDLPFPLSKMAGDAEAAASLITGVGSSLVAPVVGVAKTMLSGKVGPRDLSVREGEQAAADFVQARTYQPRTTTGRRNLEALHGEINLPFLGRDSPLRLLSGLGPPEAMALASAPKPSVPLPGINSMKPQLTTPKVRGAGATKAVDELQAQSTAVSSGGKMRDLPQQSAHEQAIVELEKVTKPLRDTAFATERKVDMEPTLALISKMEQETTNQNVLKALGEARKIIEDGVEKSGPAIPASNRMSAAEYQQMLKGGGQGQSVKLMDESRQAINDIINGRGDKPHGPFAQKQLLEVQQEMMKGAPPSYVKYLTEYTTRAKSLDPFKVPGGAREAVTTDAAAFPALTTADKQGLMEKVFTGQTPGRGLTEAVRDTAHNPEAASGLRTAYTDWLTTPDPRTGLPKAGGLITKWDDTRGAVQASGLMSPEHITAMDKVVADLGTAGSGRIAKAWASTAGFIAGGMMGRPIVGAHLARDIATETISRRNLRALEAAVAKIAADPEGAAALAAPPTPANIERVRLAALVALPGSRTQQQEQQPKRKGNAMDAINATLPVMPNVRAPQPQEGMWVRG